MSDIIKGSVFDCQKDVIFTKPKINNSGGKNIGVLNAHSKKSLYISTPLMLTWGVNEYQDEKSGKSTYDMSLQFPNAEYNTPELSQFLKALQGLEERIKTTAMENSKEWMNKAKMSQEVVDALWSPMLKYPKDKDSGDSDYSRPPTLRLKLPYWDGEFKNVEIYDINHKSLFPNDGEPTITELITKGSNVATIVQCGGIWFANGKFGVEYVDDKPTKWLIHGIGWIQFLWAYGIIGYAFFKSVDASNQSGGITPPSFVYVIVFVLFALYSSFGFVQLAELLTPLNPYTKETTYVVLSLTAKLLLGWMIFSNVLLLGD